MWLVGPEGTDYPNRIEWREIQPPSRITSLHGEKADDPRAFESEVTLVEEGDRTQLVFSNTLEEVEWRNTRLVRGRAEDEVPRLKEEEGKDLFIFGSAELTDALTERDLVDEYRIGINPLLLGGGNPLFKPSDARTRLQLLEARPMASGVVILRYGRAP